MSYILEALKKSEQQRGNGSSPTVQTIHSSALQYSRQKKPLWPYILAAVITLNVVALIVFFAPGTLLTTAQTPAGSGTNTPPAALAPAPRTGLAPAPSAATTTVTAAAAPTAEPVQTPRTEAPAPVQPPAPAAAATNTITERNDSSVIKDIHDLPMEIQARIPDMVFSAHVYSANPQQRSVVINGNFMEQGDWLTPRLRLAEITHDGVVFDLEGTRFRSSVLSDWKLH